MQAALLHLRAAMCLETKAATIALQSLVGFLAPSPFHEGGNFHPHFAAVTKVAEDKMACTLTVC